MNYLSGLMMGTAIVQGLRQFMGGGAGLPPGGAGFGRGAGNMSSFRGLMGMDSASGINAIRSGMSKSGNKKGAGEFNPDFNFKALLSAANPQMTLVSSTVGRRRYRILNLTENQAKMLENALSRVEYIKEVFANHISGSLLIIYDEEKHKLLNELMNAINTKIFKLQSNAPAKIRSASPSSAEPTVGAITKSIKNTLLAFNEWVGKKSFGLLDAGSLAFILFLIRGLRKMILNQEYPNGSQMIWWAVSMLRGWRTI